MNCNAAQAEPCRILVIAIGNPLRHDDGAGIIAARLLRRRLRARPVRFITCRQLTPELVEPIGQATYLALLDASIALPSGEVNWYEVKASAQPADMLGHQPRIETLLAMASMLYGRHPLTRVGAIGAMNLAFGRGLSAPVRQAAALLAVRVQRDIKCWLNSPRQWKETALA